MYSADTLALRILIAFVYVFFNDTATTEIYTLSLHDALPISRHVADVLGRDLLVGLDEFVQGLGRAPQRDVGRERRSEEHTSELQSRQYLVCRLLLEKKKAYRDNPLIIALI